ncbi:MAG TPA: hypothetical protein VGV41_11095 [Pseudolabrys sp.]|jgi:hypothetical protein|uniref:hypothetical protein n=1 Tax=Pseudolabrys sp. TaxID=1960880 RepID=UPI002DDD1504|nr:hypothetical protein [Pseudolabrys sp.]HEV2629181.1 hypothetical protein [Pseudolabrys sp.]
MNDDRIWPLVGRIYDGIELALWASLIAGLVVFALFILPGIPAAQQRNAAARAAAFEHECDFYCSKWGMPADTRQHARCMSDLKQFSRAVIKRIEDDDQF